MEHVKFSGISWTHDNRGFFYSRYPTPSFAKDKEGEQKDDAAGTETTDNANQMLYYHTIGPSAAACGCARVQLAARAACCSKRVRTPSDLRIGSLRVRVRLHPKGTSQEEDLLVFKDPAHPKWMWEGEVSDDGRLLFITANDSCDPVNTLYYAHIKQASGGGGVGQSMFVHRTP